ncbi:MAG TPA: sugar nucleotide-binding protein [Gaiellaceae bacterium]|nr:sugar nucleotide-binding protein [Gaiellaceae bacterium]
MRVLVTGGGGFLGSNVVAVALARGDEVTAAVRSLPPRPAAGCRYAAVDLGDAEAVRRCAAEARPDTVVHTAIWNDFHGIYRDRRRAWDEYVGVTRTVADAANAAGAVLVTVSTDWVFDGTGHLSDEETPPNPVNFYGLLKAASELVTLERARAPVVARVSGVIGRHRARDDMPRKQDAGFGYFVESVVSALEAGERFVVWESDAINAVAAPSLAGLSARWMLELAERGARGVFHCCCGEATTRMELARASAEAFGLDASLLASGPPDPAALPPAPVPYDTSMDMGATARALGREAPSLRELLELFRLEREQARADAVAAAQ